MAAMAAVITPAVWAPAVWAQDRAADTPQTRGGMRYRFDVSQRVAANTNPTLTPDGTGPVYQTNSRLAFNLSSETRTETFDLDLSGALRLSHSPDTDGIQTGAVEPQVVLSYSRFAADSRLDLRAIWQRAALEYVNPLTAFTDADGTPLLTSDFEDLSGTGTRDALTFGASLSVMDDAPFGLTLRADVTDLSYAGTTNPDLVDSTRATLRSIARFDISQVMTAEVGLSYTQIDDTTQVRKRTGIDGDLTIDRPDGSYGLNLRAVDGADGTQYGFTLAREYQMPTSAFTAGLGLTRATTDDTFVTGYLLAEHALPRATLTARAERWLGTDSQDTEELVTSLALGGRFDVGAFGAVSLDARWADNTTVPGDETTTLSSLAVTYTHDLTVDWALDATASVQTRTAPGADRGESAGLALTLRRSFDYKP